MSKDLNYERILKETLLYVATHATTTQARKRRKADPIRLSTKDRAYHQNLGVDPRKRRCWALRPLRGRLGR